MRVLRTIDPSLRDRVSGGQSDGAEEPILKHEDNTDRADGNQESMFARVSPRQALPVWNRERRPLSMLPLAAIVFNGVAGGPFGIEESIGFGGPLVCIIGLLVFPFLWCIPEAMVATELSTMFPENSGYVVWVGTAFGPFWGFIEGYSSWVSGVLDNTIYPLYLAKYTGYFVPILREAVPQKIFFVAASVMMTYWNYLGLTVSGYTAVALTVVILAPFILMFLVSIPSIHPGYWLQYNTTQFKGSFLDYLNVMFWNFSYWDSSSSLSGEVADPDKTIPRAYGLALVFVSFTYLIPVITATGVLGSMEVGDGYFSEVGNKVGGPAMAILIMVSATASQIALFESEMSSDSFLIDGLSERGFLPRFMGIRSRHGTPTIGLLMSCIGIVCMVLNFSFEDVVDMLNSAYCLGILLEFAAFIYLRIKAPNAKRPFRAPLSTTSMCLVLLPASVFIFIILIVPLIQMKILMIVFNSILVVTGILSYWVLNWCRKKYPGAFNSLTLQSITDLKGADDTQDEYVASSHLLGNSSHAS